MGKTTTKFKNYAIKSIITLAKQLNFPKRNIQAAPSRFLVISTTGIGDTLWGTPAIRALKETYPGCYIGVLTNPSGFQVLKENPNIDDFFIFERGFNGFLKLPGLIKSLRQRKFEVAFIFHASDRIIWPICFFTGASEIIGICGQSKDLDFILTSAIDSQKDIHGIETRLKLVQNVGASTIDRAVSIQLTGKDREMAKRFLKKNNINEDSLLIGLHPGAQKPFKCWPSKNFIAVGNILADKLRCKIIVTGDASEKALAQGIASKIKGATSVAGRFSLRETAAIIEKMDIFITNDTGPMHIAFALKTPTIALFSPTDPKLCGPYNVESATVIAKPPLCDPCIGKKCYKPFCMEQITVEEVIAKAESWLRSREGYYLKNLNIEMRQKKC